MPLDLPVLNMIRYSAFVRCSLITRCDAGLSLLWWPARTSCRCGQLTLTSHSDVSHSIEWDTSVEWDTTS